MKVEEVEATDNESLILVKKVDLGVVISSLSKEIERARKAKEVYQTNQQKVLKLLEIEYKERLDITTFIKACSFFKDEGNIVTFTTLSDIIVRD